jgi:hypothetical protein
MTINLPKIGDTVPWNEIPEFWYNDFYHREFPPPDGVVVDVFPDSNYCIVQCDGYFIHFDIDGSSWDSTGQWKREFQWGYQREQVNQEELDGFAEMQ